MQALKYVLFFEPPVLKIGAGRKQWKSTKEMSYNSFQLHKAVSDFNMVIMKCLVLPEK